MLAATMRTGIRVLPFCIPFLASACQPPSPGVPSATVPAFSPQGVTRPPTSVVWQAPTPEPTFQTPAAPNQLEPAVPLSQEGPWIAFAGRDSGIAVSDFAGPGFIQLPDPAQEIPPCEFIFDLTASPRGGLVSFKCEISETELELLVFRLPSGDLLARFPLLGASALEAILHSGETPIPYPPPVRQSLYFSPSVWSPSGRYLAYAGAPETASTDLYVFDAVSLSNAHLTSGPDQTQIIGWSPDSNWVVHSSFAFGEVDTYVLATWAASVHTSEIHKLYDVNESIVAEHIVGWVNPNQVITDRTQFEGCTYSLRSTLIGGASTVLSSWGFSSAALDAVNGNIVIARSEEPFCQADLPGLYSLDLSSNQVSRISNDGYWSVGWSEQSHALIARSDNGDIAILSSVRGPFLSFPNAQAVSPSPDGLWFLVDSSGHIRVSTASGEEVLSLITTQRHEAAWHPDSTAFVVSYCDPCSSNGLQILEYHHDRTWHQASFRHVAFAPSSVEIVVVPQ